MVTMNPTIVAGLQELNKPTTVANMLKFLSDKNNRCWHLLKRKDFQDDTFDFLSISPTIGDKGEPGFRMTLKSKSSTKPTFCVGGGLSHSERDHYLVHPDEIKTVKVKYLCLSEDGIPTGNPTILCINPTT